jgi:hypothetical protein
VRKLERLAVAFAIAVVDVVRDEAAHPTGDYATTNLPRGVSRRTFHAVCRSGRVHGAVREGRRWRCSRAAWHSARTTRASADDADIAERALLGSDSQVVQLRATRRGRT